MGTLVATSDTMVPSNTSKGTIEVTSEEEGKPFPFDSELPGDTAHAVGSSANGIR